MIDSKTVTVLWAYLEEFDKTNNPAYLISAWSLFEGLVEREKLPEFSTRAFTYKIVYPRGGGGAHPEGVLWQVNEENVSKFAQWWVTALISNSELKGAGLSFILQLSKYSLIKVLTALGAVTNPFEFKSAELAEEVEFEVREE